MLHSHNVCRLIETLIKSVWCCQVAQLYLYIMPLSGDWIAGYGDTDDRDTDDTGDKRYRSSSCQKMGDVTRYTELEFKVHRPEMGNGVKSVFRHRRVRL